MLTATPVSKPLPTEDPVGVFVTKLISQLVTGVAPKVIIDSATAAFPPLAWPVINLLFGLLVDTLAGKISVIGQAGSLQLVFAVEKGTATYKILGALAAYSAAQNSGDQSAIDKAQADAVNQWGEVIHFGGVAPIKP